MKSLFLRIFLLYCLGTGILIVTTSAGVYFTIPDTFFTSWRSIGHGAMLSMARSAAEKYERQGPAELRSHLQQMAVETGLRSYLLNPAGRDLAGLLPPEDAPLALARLSAQSTPGPVFLRHLAAVETRGPSAARYVFLARMPPRDEGILWSAQGMGFIRLAAFLFTGTIICYLLSLYLSAPVVHLRRVAHRFSGGELTARVTDPALLSRRDELGALSRDFNDMAARIQILMAAQRRLLADVSHELRSPLTRIGVALGLARRKAPPGMEPALERIESEAARLNGLIEQLLTLSRLESSAEPPPKDRADLAALLREIVADADFEACGRNRAVRVELGSSCSILMARDLLRSAIENVVRNALRYTGESTEVLVRLEGPDGMGRACITVQDHGPGVPESGLPHLFKPFYRVADARDRQSGGAGLGLAITHQVVSLHGGEVSASNLPGGGLEVRISIPIS